MSETRRIPVVFSTGSLYNFGLERVFGWASEVGYDGVEVMMDDRWDTHEEDYLRRLSEGYGMPIQALHPPIYEGAWRLPAGETLVRAAKLARSLDIPTVVAHPPGKALSEWSRGPLAEARQTGITVAVENMPKSGPKKRVISTILRSQGPSGVYLPEQLGAFDDVTLDTSHVAASKLDLMDFHSRVAPRLRHVHLSDSDLTGGDQHRLPGKGGLPLKPFLGALSSGGYEGVVSLELKPFQAGAPHPEKILSRMSDALSYAREGLG